MADKADKEVEAPGLASSSGRRVVFVRHGKTEWNKLFRYQGATDVPLCPEGEEQARRAALRLARMPASRVVSSPLLRSRRTAEIIAEAVGVSSVEVWDGLIEVNFGDWEGLTVPEIKERYGDAAFGEWRNSPLDYNAPGGEDMQALYDRSQMVVSKIIGLPDDNMIVVGHGAMFRALLLPMVDMPRCSVFWRARMDNCSLSGVDIDGNGRASIAFLNDTLHLKVKIEDIGGLPMPW